MILTPVVQKSRASPLSSPHGEHRARLSWKRRTNEEGNLLELKRLSPDPFCGHVGLRADLPTQHSVPAELKFHHTWDRLLTSKKAADVDKQTLHAHVAAGVRAL